MSIKKCHGNVMKINLMSEANKAILHCWKLDRDEAVVYFLSLQGPLPWAKNVIKVKQHSVREEKRLIKKCLFRRKVTLSILNIVRRARG